MSVFKRFNCIAIATVLYTVAAPALAANESANAPTEPAVKWLMRVVPTPQRVNEDVIEEIRPGIDESGVKALIGKPNTTVRFPRSETTSWDYSYRDAWGYPSTFSAIFNDDHIMVSKVTLRRPY